MNKSKVKCKKCNGSVVKNGKQVNGQQRYYCKSCKCSFQARYSYNAYKSNTNKHIYKLLIESVGIRFISRLLNISKTTVIKRIKYLASLVSKPIFEEKHQYYEMDEMRVVVGRKKEEAWITYAINRNTKQVIDFVAGRKTRVNISVITKSVFQLFPKMIFTDRLPTYKSSYQIINITTRKGTQQL